MTAIRPLIFALLCLATFAAPILLVRAQEGTANPHGDLKVDCGSCHTPEGWSPLRQPIDFDHGTTGFALEAAHGRAQCRSCHQSLVFAHVGTACADCHRDPHRGELGVQCETCHAPRTWTNRREMFEVHSRTRFPLFAAHATVECEGCHRTQRPQEFASTPTECGACHLDDFQATRNPDHVRAGFSRRCEDCHRVTTRTWAGSARFGPHPASFPLRGAHANLTCSRCHAAGFTGTSPQCVSCHRPDFNAARDPNHVAGGFSTDCASCHTDTAWKPASFDHSRSRFPLTGAHARVPCSECHRQGFSGTSSDCVSCHRANYDRTTSPNHRSANFPTQCESCHSTAAWRPANFDHDARFFPIDSGRHRGTWSSCANCHVNSGSFAVFECVGCHDHSRSEMDDKHRRVGGYEYRSPACYRCHPRGNK